MSPPPFAVTRHLVLPQTPVGELSDSELDAAAGGAVSGSVVWSTVDN